MDSFVSTGALLICCLENAGFRGAMNQPFDPLLLNIVLATLAIGLPIVMVLAIRFLWDRNLNLGRSKELEKLIWQLHRIASAMEHQMNLSFPAVQPGTEEARDLAYLQRGAQTTPATRGVAIPGAGVAPVATPQPVVQQPFVPQPVAQQPVAAPVAAQPESLPALERREPSAESQRAGVNSMFGL
jgi:hypothetical protein